MKKLVKCKSCGGEISRTSKICPHCGAKQKKHVFLIVVIVIVLVGVIGSIAGESEDSGNVQGETTPEDVVTVQVEEEVKEETKEETIEISAVDLWNAYEENKVSADEKYNGKTLELTGVIQDITQDTITKDPCVKIDSGSPYSLQPIECFFYGSDENIEKISALKDGQEVVIIGKCNGTPLINIQITQCKIK